MLRSKRAVIVLFVISICIHIVSFLSMFQHIFFRRTVVPVKNEIVNTSVNQYPLLSPRIFIEEKNDIFVNMMPLRNALRTYIETQEEDMSLYFEYLPSGVSIGINDTQEYEMASLIKLPVIMMIYNKLLKKEITKDTMLSLEKQHIDSSYGDLWKEGVGADFTVMEMIEKSLIDSDNTAHQLLYSLLNVDEKKQLFSNIDMRVEEKEGILVPFITAKSYASILKTLYLSSYLPPELSQEVLQLLTQTKTKSGITQGVDQGVVVAEKSGELELAQQIDVLNNCGIVYYPKRPYILCILVHGEDEEGIYKKMAFISKLIFSYVRDINKDIPIGTTP